jgi:hypothetical protein
MTKLQAPKFLKKESKNFVDENALSKCPVFVITCYYTRGLSVVAPAITNTSSFVNVTLLFLRKHASIVK